MLSRWAWRLWGWTGWWCQHLPLDHCHQSPHGSWHVGCRYSQTEASWLCEPDPDDRDHGSFEGMRYHSWSAQVTCCSLHHLRLLHPLLLKPSQFSTYSPQHSSCNVISFTSSRYTSFSALCSSARLFPFILLQWNHFISNSFAFAIFLQWNLMYRILPRICVVY